MNKSYNLLKINLIYRLIRDGDSFKIFHENQ